MIIACVAKDFTRCSALTARLWLEPGIELILVVTGPADAEPGWEQLRHQRLDLAIVDEQLDGMSGIDFVRQLVRVNPLANTAIVGTMAPETFHEATEGLGVLAQLPLNPSEADIRALLLILARINGLIARSSRVVRP
ncbi:hypothetical protein [Desulfobulbus sp.]|uniref:hypothetical protein n=1 Tax=Desulfobulbus sp. TaxID=895 RepID=UPI00286F4199|nr:hypothetical protein [Desulfobulbus sp.]